MADTSLPFSSLFPLSLSLSLSLYFSLFLYLSIYLSIFHTQQSSLSLSFSLFAAALSWSTTTKSKRIHTRLKNECRRCQSEDGSSSVAKLLFLATMDGVWEAVEERWWNVVLLPLLLLVLGPKRFNSTCSSKWYPCSWRKCPNHRHTFLCKDNKLCQLI